MSGPLKGKVVDQAMNKRVLDEALTTAGFLLFLIVMIYLPDFFDQTFR